LGYLPAIAEADLLEAAHGLRVAVGPADPAGCGSALVSGLRELGVDAELAVTFPHPFGFPADRVVRGRARLAYGASAPFTHDVLHFQSWSWLPRDLDVQLARALRRTVVINFHGDDCRLYTLTRALFPRQAQVGDGRGDAAVRRRLGRLGRIAHAAIVKDLELATYVYPFFERVFLVASPVQAHLLEQPAPLRDAARPVVLHAPSDPRYKGTRAIERAIESVQKVAPLEFRLISGVTHGRLQEELRAADIVVDQLDAVATGVFALEAMAAGKPVLAEYDPSILPPFQRDVPIVRVSPQTLADRLAELVSDVDRRRELGAAGRRYVERVHGPTRVARAALRVYDGARGAPAGLYEATAEGVAPLEPDLLRLEGFALPAR
jgi:glycosyltransferase involved in cell wall biosynthesis